MKYMEFTLAKYKMKILQQSLDILAKLRKNPKQKNIVIVLATYWRIPKWKYGKHDYITNVKIIQCECHELNVKVPQTEEMGLLFFIRQQQNSEYEKIYSNWYLGGSRIFYWDVAVNYHKCIM